MLNKTSCICYVIYSVVHNNNTIYLCGAWQHSRNIFARRVTRPSFEFLFRSNLIFLTRYVTLRQKRDINAGPTFCPPVVLALGILLALNNFLLPRSIVIWSCSALLCMFCNSYQSSYRAPIMPGTPDQNTVMCRYNAAQCIALHAAL